MVGAINASASPTSGNPYATVGDISSSLNGYLPLAGGTMTGPLINSETTYDSEFAGWGLGIEQSDDHTKGTTVEFNGLHTYDGPNSVHVNPTGITFPDSTIQTTAALPLTGGTMTGSVDINSGGTAGSTHSEASISFTNTGVSSWLDAESFGISSSTGSVYLNTTDGINGGLYMLDNNGGEMRYNANGITFPDGSVQTTATLTGPQGPQGPQGNNGNDGSNGSNGSDGGSFSDVSNDSIPYIRINQSWQPLSSYDQQGGGGISDANSDNTPYIRYNGAWQPLSYYDQTGGGGGGISDAPTDGQFYARNNGNWQSFTTSTGSVGEAPYNGSPYVRINGEWQAMSNYDQTGGGGGGIGEAPYNNAPYIRINGEWQPLSNYDQTGGGSQGPQGDQGPQGNDGPMGGSFGDAPYDNTSYVRINNNWSQTFRDLTTYNASGDPFYPYEVKITVNGTDYWMPVRPA